MKLLICTSEYFPHGSGIANVVYNVVEQLKNKGVECIICSPSGPDITLGSNALIRKTGFLGLLYFWILVSHYFKNKPKEWDVAWLHNPYFIGHNPFSCCIVTVHTTYYGMSHHCVGNTVFLRIYNEIISKLEHFCYRKTNPTTIFTAVGQSVCEELEKIGIAKERIVYIPNGVDITKFHPSEHKEELRKKFGIPEDEIILLSIGRLTSQKQPFTLVDIFSIIEKRIKNISLYISGKGELFNATKNRAKRNNVMNIQFLGYISDEDLPNLYACCNYYIMTSKYEGQPLTLLEAMASGLPCIVSDIPHLEIVKDADCGITIHFGSTERSASEIIEFLSVSPQKYSNNARLYAEKMLDWKVISQKYYELSCSYIKSSIGK